MNIASKLLTFIKKLFGRYNYLEELRKKGVMVGNNTHIFATYFDESCPFLISIGDNVTITRSTILAHDASTNKPLGLTKIGRVKIGNNVFIGAGSLVLPNVTIGDNCIIGGGSVVVKSIPDNSVAVGNPAKVISSYDEYIKRMRAKIEDSIVIRQAPNTLTDDEKRKLRDNMDSIGFIL